MGYENYSSLERHIPLASNEDQDHDQDHDQARSIRTSLGQVEPHSISVANPTIPRGRKYIATAIYVLD